MSFSIETGKESGVTQANVTPKPLILCSLASLDGDTVYLTTSAALGGTTLTWNGKTYQARLLSNPVDQIQANSPQGYDIPGSITLQIADGDFAIWTNHCVPHAWRGGTLTVNFILWDIPSNTYSTNAYSWAFILGKPDINSKGILKVSAQAKQSLTRMNVPNYPRQNRCGNNFPATAAQRLDGLLNPTSPYWMCGYSPDYAALGGVGNTTTANLTNPDGSQLTDANGIYVMCDYTRSCGPGKATRTQGCMARLGDYSATVFHGGSTPCASDGDIIDDASGRRTGRFTGDTYIAPVGWQGKQYTNPSAGKLYGFNTPNPATGSTYYNIGYGTQWVNATVLAPFGDPNSDRAECVVCMAPFGSATILKVLVNGVEVTQNNSDVLFTYRVLNSGGRNSTVSLDADYGGQGDPHGSMCWIEVVVPTQLVQAGAIPQVQVLVQFPRCLHAYPVATATISGGNTILTFPAGVPNQFFDGVIVGQSFFLKGNTGVPDGSYIATAVSAGPPGTTGTITIAGTWSGTGGALCYVPVGVADDGFVDNTGAMAENPVWALFDLLCIWGPFTIADFDLTSWYSAAQVCAAPISYTDINGNSQTHARYRCSLALTNENRMTLAKAVLGIRNCAGIILARNSATGLIQCAIEQTLADQQSAPIAGSNYNTGVASYKATGNPALPPTGTGYLAYLFDGNGSIEKDTLEITGRGFNDTPNTVSFPFQDSANGYVQDTIQVVDPDGYESAGNQQIADQIDILGIENFDQGHRRAVVELSKALYGNLRGDAGGTELIQIKTSVKAAHLASQPGAICGIRYDQLGL